jgi:hypothetical protein
MNKYSNFQKSLVTDLIHQVMQSNVKKSVTKKYIQKAQSDAKFFNNMGIGDLAKPMSKNIAKAESPNNYLQSKNENFPSFTYQNNPERQQNYGKYNNTTANSDMNQKQSQSQQSPYAGNSSTSTKSPYAGSVQTQSLNVSAQANTMQPQKNSTNSNQSNINVQQNIKPLSNPAQQTFQNNVTQPAIKQTFNANNSISTLPKAKSQTFADFMSSQNKNSATSIASDANTTTVETFPNTKPVTYSAQAGAASTPVMPRAGKIIASSASTMSQPIAPVITGTPTTQSISNPSEDVSRSPKSNQAGTADINTSAFDYLNSQKFKYIPPKEPKIFILDKDGKPIIPTKEKPYTAEQIAMVNQMKNKLQNVKPGTEVVFLNKDGQQIGMDNVYKLPKDMRQLYLDTQAKNEDAQEKSYNKQKNARTQQKNALINNIKLRLRDAIATGNIPPELQRYIK